MSVAREALGGQHRRGRSLPSNMVKSDRDDDLALFHDMRRRERVNYLHPSSDNDEVIESSLSSKYGALSGCRPSTFAQHKNSNDLLVSDPDKSDYDWLLTPPGTPLFPSLDHDSSLSSLAQGALYARYMPSVKASRLSSGRTTEPNSKVTKGNSSPRRQSTPSSVGAPGRGKTTAVLASNTGPASRPSSRPSSPSGRPGSCSMLSVPGDGLDRPSIANGRSLILSEGVNARPSTTSSNERPSIPTESKGRLASSNGKPSIYGEGNVRPGTPASRPSTPGEGSVRSASARPSTSSEGQLRASQTRPSIPTEARARPWTPTEAGARPSTPIARSTCGDGHSQSSAVPGEALTPGEGSATSLASSPGPSAPEEGYARLPRIILRATVTDESSTNFSTPGGRSSPHNEGFGRASFSDLPSPASVEGPGWTQLSSGRPSLAADGREKTGSRPSTPRGRTLTPASKPSSPVLRSSTAVTARPSTPTRSLSTRPSTPTRSTTPTLHRTSSGPTMAPSTRSMASRGGPSPVRASTATKSPAVYPALPDFPSEPPPNLRTSLAEGQSLSTRGPRRSSSPAPRASQAPECETMSRPRGRASSPNMSRSFSDRSSSQTSRRIDISPSDDGTEGTRPSAFSGRGTDGRKSIVELEGRIASKMGLQSKRAGRPSGARETSIFGGTFPRKSTDWQHMELRSSVGYRPVPSNTPGLSFFSGGSSSVLHRACSNLESSIATSSNASSTVSMTADTEGSEQDVDEMISEWDKRVSPSRRVEILILDKDDEKSFGWGGSQDDRYEKREASNFDRFEVDSNAGSEATTTYGSMDNVSVGMYDPDSRPFEFSAYGASTSVGGHEDSSELRDKNGEVMYAQQNDGFDSSIDCEDGLRLSSGHKELREGSDDQTSGILADNAFVDIQEDQGAGLREVQGAYEPGQGPISIDTSSWTDIQEPVTIQQMGKREDFVSFQAGPLEDLQILKHLQLNLRRGDSHRNAKLDLNSTCGSSSTCDTKLSGTGDTDFSSDLQSQGSSLSVDHRYSHDWTDIQVIMPQKEGSLSFKASGREGKVDGIFTSASLPKYVDYSPSAYFGTDLYRSTDTGLSTSTSSWEDQQYGLDLKFWDSKACIESPALSEDGKIQANIRMQNMSPDKSCRNSVNKEPVGDSVVLKGDAPLDRFIGMKGTACESLLPLEQRCFDLFPGHGDNTQEDSGGAEGSRKTGDVVESDVSKIIILNEAGAISVSSLVQDRSRVTTELVQQEPDAAETVVSGSAVGIVGTGVELGQMEVKDDGMVLSAVVQRLKLLKESQAVRGDQVQGNDESTGECRKPLPSPYLASPSPGVEDGGKMQKVVTQDAFSLFIDGFEEQFYSETSGNRKAGHDIPSRRQRSPLRPFQQGDMARSQSQSQKGVTNNPPRIQTGETTEKATIPAKVAARDVSDEEPMAFHDSVERDEHKAVVSERAEVDYVATPSPTLELVSFTGRSGLEGHSAAEMSESGRWKGPGGSAVRRSLTYLDTSNCKGRQSGVVLGKVVQVEQRTAKSLPAVSSAEQSDSKICRCVVL